MHPIVQPNKIFYFKVKIKYLIKIFYLAVIFEISPFRKAL